MKPPQDGDVTIVWKNKKAVDIYIVVRTYSTTANLSVLLDAQSGGQRMTNMYFRDVSGDCVVDGDLIRY